MYSKELHKLKKVSGYIVIILLTGFLLGVGFLLIGGIASLGFSTDTSVRLSVAGLPVPLLLGYLCPVRYWRCALLFFTGSVGVLFLLRTVLLGSDWEYFVSVPVWEWSNPVAKLYAVYIWTGVALVLVGSWLRRRGRCLGVILILFICTPSFVAGLWVMSDLRGYGLLPFAQGGRVPSYLRLLDNLDRYYGHWESSPISLRELRAMYLPQVRIADRECGFLDACPQYRNVVRRMLAELRDGHTHLQGASALVRPKVRVEEIEGEAVVTAVASMSEAEDSGMIPGMIIRSVDGVPVSDVLANVPAYLTAYSAPHTRRRRAYQSLLLGISGPVRVTVETLSGQNKTIALTRRSVLQKQVKLIESRRISQRFGYVAVRGLSAPGLVGEFDSLIDDLMGNEGLILDLRGNGGGSSQVGEAMVARLILETLSYGSEYFRGGHPLKARGVGGAYPAIVRPRSPTFLGAVAVLIDGDVSSSAEWMALALCEAGSARCFGRRTSGDSGNPVIHFLPGLTLQFSAGDFRRNSGQALNGIGVEPHVQIDWTIKDVIQGQDPDIEKAIEWLSESPY